MLEILQWIFGSFWRFAGVIVLLVVIFDGLAAVTRGLSYAKRAREAAERTPV